ncbi:MAG: nitroreductase family deazaflavin-dependent oxidoreductase [Anaerolineae bacterium]|nr:nitroreductase family deazaflavin-dependent oxidoreductase [Anaerolineae bacterium]
MAKTYQVTTMVRFVNKIMQGLVRWGVGPKQTYLLTVRGRKSGKLYSTPVSLVEEGDKRWLVAPYGEVSWVKNARAAGEVTLTQGRRSETVAIEEVGPEESGPVLQKYIKLESITQPYFEVGLDAPVEAFVAEASRHPVFRIDGKQP